jgi:hypothetical protein
MGDVRSLRSVGFGNDEQENPNELSNDEFDMRYVHDPLSENVTEMKERADGRVKHIA